MVDWRAINAEPAPPGPMHDEEGNLISKPPWQSEIELLTLQLQYVLYNQCGCMSAVPEDIVELREWAQEHLDD